MLMTYERLARWHRSACTSTVQRREFSDHGISWPSKLHVWLGSDLLSAFTIRGDDLRAGVRSRPPTCLCAYNHIVKSIKRISPRGAISAENLARREIPRRIDTAAHPGGGAPGRGPRFGFTAYNYKTDT